MAAPSNTAGQPKYGASVSSGQEVYPIVHAFDASDLTIAPPSSAFDGEKIVPSVPSASGQQVHPTITAFDGIILAPTESSLGMKQLPYDVFINHHGGDVKLTVANTIYQKLDATGLRVFLDKNELKLGDFFPRALEEAMGTASIHIAIFSENYAHSPWCLAELAFMLQTGIKFIPIFFHVEPSTLRWAIEGKGCYAKAFSKDEMKRRYTSEKLRSWSLALHKASLYNGETISNQG